MKIQLIKKLLIIILIIIILILPLAILDFEEEKDGNKKPVVTIDFPKYGGTVSKIVTISGSAMDSNGNQTLKKVEIKINNEWIIADGTVKWTYTWDTFDIPDGYYNISVKAWDGALFSNIKEIVVRVYNPKVVESEAHKWAIFVVAANFPEENESKLGNGGLFLAEEMAAYFIENLSYPTSNIIILFDDGWIRSENGFGNRVQTLQQRYHQYDIGYAAATKQNLVTSLQYIINEANRFEDSEVFIWLSSHGCGDEANPYTGGKILDRSAIFLWDFEELTDRELGNLLQRLESKETCVIVDACFSGGFADKTIYNFPELFLLKSGISKSGSVVMTGASKFRVGYASTIFGPLFSRIWFEGLRSKEADGFRPGILKIGRPTRLRIFKDQRVSVEEAFYYTRYILSNDEFLEEYSTMQPQINDRYPRFIFPFNDAGLILG